MHGIFSDHGLWQSRVSEDEKVTICVVIYEYSHQSKVGKPPLKISNLRFKHLSAVGSVKKDP